MKEKTFATINGKIIYIDRYYYESDEMFYFRLKYIIDNYNDNINLDKLIGLSKIEQQKKFNDCEYDLSSRI
jgi:hypothetical protein